MIAYLILVHRFPDQFKRLFKAIYDPDNYYLIHVDQRSGVELETELKQFLASYPNVAMLQSKKMLWGGYSLVDAELRGIKQLLTMGVDWEFFINLSGQDFPLKTQSYIHEFLNDNIGNDFMKIANQATVRPDTLHRIEDYCVEEADQIFSPLPAQKRPFMEGVTPYIGNQWMILSRGFCEFLTRSPEVSRFVKFYKNTLIADEGFFQTVIMNTSYSANIVNDDKRAIDWVPMGTIKLRPREFTTNDASALLASKHLFARKFDETIDTNILDIIEQHLKDTQVISRHTKSVSGIHQKLEETV
ncbi:beta-1,6-N-acetylglucosaminyltransferase [Methylobacillus gramineus]|uniref:beta-1,6-N-acetylglucosaminyltransferase n=1 Tax=Methylobacillus gramineus TaxID=755169 RepID=UPI001CFF9FC0|nr:beta-1,6-N-acetylglucosaminyltransferase [Methylobacillus gramineus]MCB5184290.1 beta-1,6-N-acetylglucosaminyltransferase [Methylobacillus gramineus]